MSAEIPLAQSPLFHENAVSAVLGNSYALRVVRALSEKPVLPLEDLASILVHESDRLAAVCRLSEAHLVNYSVNALRLTGYGVNFIMEYRERINQ